MNPLWSALLESMRRAPDGVAIASRSRSLTYTELIDAAILGGEALRQSGVGPGDRVGVCVKSRLEGVIAVTSCASADTFVVPLDGDRSGEWLARALEAVEVKAVITDSEQLAAMCLKMGVGVTSPTSTPPPLRALRSSTKTGPASTKHSQSGYVMFTSGTTGRPRAVIVEHSSLIEHIQGVSDYLKVSPGERLFHFMPLTFDPSQQEIWTALTNAATLVLAEDRLPSLRSLIHELDGGEVTIAVLPTGIWQLLARRLDTLPEPPTHLHTLYVGGELMELGAARSWFETQWARISLVNMYGPTEGVIAATASQVTAEMVVDDRLQYVPVGRELPGHSVCVVRDDHTSANPEIVGEVALTGCLAAQIIGDGQHARARFFNDSAGTTWYLTGDVGRWWPEHGLEVLGRRDSQVKIAGKRVELGEIEATLLQHPGVTAATVVFDSESTNTKRLTAFIVGSVEATDVTEFARRQLAHHMLPVVRKVNTIPLGKHGKVDRTALLRLARDEWSETPANTQNGRAVSSP